MESTTDTARDLSLLEHIEQDPDITQATLAAQLGVAVGTVNWHLKRLVSKGYIKVKRAERRKLRYIITPQGVALRARLTVEYVERSFRIYRITRETVTQHLETLEAAGYEAVRIDSELKGPEDILDVCKLTCLEQGVDIVEDADAPVLQIKGVRVLLHLPEEQSANG